MASLIQKKSGSSASASSLAVTFTNPVASGNIIVVAAAPLVGSVTPVTVSSITDSQLNTYTNLVAISKTATDSADSEIWYATAGATSANTVTVHLSGTSLISVGIYEINGYSTTNATSTTGIGLTATTTTNMSVTSFTPKSGAFVIATGDCDTGKSGWTKDAAYSTDDDIAAWNNNQYQENWAGGATTAPFTPGTPTVANLPWSEVVGAFPSTNQAVILYKVTGT